MALRPGLNVIFSIVADGDANEIVWDEYLDERMVRVNRLCVVHLRDFPRNGDLIGTAREATTHHMLYVCGRKGDKANSSPTYSAPSISCWSIPRVPRLLTGRLLRIHTIRFPNTEQEVI